MSNAILIIKNMKDKLEEVECNMCGSIMWYNEEDGIHECTNSECTRCND
jgi:hypothetical protein